MNTEKSFNVLILSTDLFNDSEKIKNIVQTSEKFDNSSYIKITAYMSESEWDKVVANIRSCDKVITI